MSGTMSQGSSTSFGLGLLCGMAMTLLVGASTSDRVGLIWRAIDLIESEYIDERQTDQLIYDAIGGLTQGLDDHSIFLDPDSYAALQETTVGEYSGVGLDARVRDDHAAVMEVIPDSPAQLGGVQVGDRIVEVDGFGVGAAGVEGLLGRLRGPTGSLVEIGLLRGSEAATWQRLDIVLRRAKVKVPSVFVDEVRPGVHHIKIARFQRDTAEELRVVLEAIPSPLLGLVLDLRGNPGGYLSEAVEIADFWLDRGILVTTLDRTARADHDRAKVRGTDRVTPLSVLIDSDSASAAEILAGALRDHKRARLVGYPSYGKGSVQRFFELGDGSALKLTTARYYTPAGEHFAGDGLQPDLVLGPRGASSPSFNLEDLLRNDAGSPMGSRGALEEDPALGVAVEWLQTPDRVDGWFQARLAALEE